MAITLTTLSAALTATADAMVVASTTGAAVGKPVRIGDEWALVAELPGGGLVRLAWRGSRGTLAKAHTTAEPVAFYASHEDIDLPGPREHDAAEIYDHVVNSINADGAITVPARNTILLVTKGSACAMTLAAPSKDSDGVFLHIISRTAYAHTVTYTPGFQGDTTSSDVATFAAKKGANLLLRAVAGEWVCVNIVASATAQVVIG